MEEVACEEHVDPRVAAAVEAGQEHGNDEGGRCGVGREERKTGCHSGAIPDLPDSAMVLPETAIPGTTGWVTRQSDSHTWYVFVLHPCLGFTP